MYVQLVVNLQHLVNIQISLTTFEGCLISKENKCHCHGVEPSPAWRASMLTPTLQRTTLFNNAWTWFHMTTSMGLWAI